MQTRQQRRHRGFALLEVLIAVLVMAFGMLGIAKLLIFTTRSNASSGMKQQAIQSAYNMLDRVRANRTSALAGGYDASDVTTTGTPVPPAQPSVLCDSTASCSAAQLATYDTWYWLAKDLTALPAGSGSIVRQPSGAATLVTVTVQWDDSPAQAQLGAAASSPAGSPNLARFVVQTLL
ncbi:MAG: type IV pilus modification protein PilV [Proteobacteria bacterium]|nr:type IV pilus modification protein PilV [Pseudomonadota bacterium]